jgi:hypothetical protein
MTEVLTAPVTEPLPAGVHRSRWGFHPVDYPASLKLRAIAKAVRRAQRLAAAWQRWERKQPQNRVSRPRVRNAGGQVVSYGPPVPLPEPLVLAQFTAAEDVRGYVYDPVAKRCGHYGAVIRRDLSVKDFGVLSAAKACRQPAATPAEVKSLPPHLTPAEIDRLYALATAG